MRYSGGMTAGTLLREARTRAALTQSELARRAGVAQSVISAYESGRREPSLRTLQRLIAATGGTLVLDFQPGPAAGIPRTPLGDLVRQRRDEVLAIAARYGVTNIRLFGSAARGDDDEHSDIDLLVDLPPKMSLFTLIAFEREVSDALGAKVDVVPAEGLKERVRASAEQDAVAL